MTKPKWPGDHEAKHSAAARKGWATRRANGNAGTAGKRKPPVVIKSCPGCGSYNPSNEHLIWEYKDLQKDTLSGHFKLNARKAQNGVADALRARGIRKIPNAFGDYPIRKWE